MSLLSANYKSRALQVSPGNHVEPGRHMEVGGLCLLEKYDEIEKRFKYRVGGGPFLSVALLRDLAQQESLSPMFSLEFWWLPLWQTLGLSGSRETLHEVETVWEKCFTFCPLKTWTSVSNKPATKDQAHCQPTSEYRNTDVYLSVVASDLRNEITPFMQI